jgi:hypothetical protein
MAGTDEMALMTGSFGLPCWVPKREAVQALRDGFKLAGANKPVSAYASPMSQPTTKTAGGAPARVRQARSLAARREAGGDRLHINLDADAMRDLRTMQDKMGTGTTQAAAITAALAAAARRKR